MVENKQDEVLEELEKEEETVEVNGKKVSLEKLIKGYKKSKEKKNTK